MSVLLATVNGALLALLATAALLVSSLVLAAARADSRERGRRTLVDLATIARSPLTTALSVLVPAHESPVETVAAVRALLAADFPSLEVIVIDDGATDTAIATLRRAFSLVGVERVPRSRIATARLRCAYASPHEPRLLVLAKEPGDRADALNTGLRFARYPIVCAVDPQIAVDRDAFARLARAFQTNPETIACGAGTRFRDARAPLARLRTSRRLRLALLARTGAWRLGAPLLGANALNVFDRQVVVEAGGWQPAGGAEDLELVLRLHRRCADSGRAFRIASLAQPAGTSGSARPVPDRGVISALARHRGMFFRPRHGVLGCLLLPLATAWMVLRRPLGLCAFACVVGGVVTGAIAPVLVLSELALALTAAAALPLGGVLLDRRTGARADAAAP